MRQAIRLLNQAVAHDPSFLLAYCQLAHAHDLLYFFGVDHSPARLALAEEALAKALQLGPDRGEPQRLQVVAQENDGLRFQLLHGQAPFSEA